MLISVEKFLGTEIERDRGIAKLRRIGGKSEMERERIVCREFVSGEKSGEGEKRRRVETVWRRNNDWRRKKEEAIGDP